MWTGTWTTRSMSDTGVLDTSVLIDLQEVDPELLPAKSSITALSLAELTAGLDADIDLPERARRQERLLWVAEIWPILSFDSAAARAYGRIHAATRSSGRSVRPRRIDLLIASVALAQGLPLYTRNFDEFSHLGDLIDVRAV